jgi:RNA-directed DNA polymerase
VSRSSTPPISRLPELKAAQTLRDLANLLSIKPTTLSYVLYKLGEDKKYTTFQIPKRNGGHRTIKAPVRRLKLIQRKLSDLLQDCVDDINKTTGRKDISAQGFKRDRSILTNARRHRQRKYIFNLDLADFFPTVNFGRVRGFFIKNRDFELHKDVATVIAQIACHDHTLPQGSPCSPVISNLVTNLLDVRLVRLASSAGATYTRYADDLTFSSNKREFPSEIAAPGTDPHSWLPSKALRGIIERTGFTINDSKSHMMYRRSRQDVTGLIVNKKVNVRCEYRHTVRAMVHRLVTTGSFHVFGATPQAGFAERPGTRNELHGMLGFINSIDVFNRDKTADHTVLSLVKKEQSYREFLLYSHFHANERPVVICEGNTDNVYLTHAIRSLAKDFPELAEIKPDGTIRLKVRLYKYPQTSTARILGLKDGGSGHLTGFLQMHKKETEKFKAPGLTDAVIVLYDNDDGAAPINKALKGTFKVNITGKEPFVHLHKNVYAATTPLIAGNVQSRIEDFFTAQTLALPYDGKTFNPAKDADKTKHFSKQIFAHKVVRPNADKIDFTGFKPLLTNITAAILKHRNG